MKLNHKIFGSGEETLIILHGLLGSLDNWQSLALRFSNKIWHSNTFQQSGFYTNRICAKTWIDLFSQNGYHIEKFDIELNTEFYLKRMSVHNDCSAHLDSDGLKQKRLILNLKKVNTI